MSNTIFHAHLPNQYMLYTYFYTHEEGNRLLQIINICYFNSRYVACSMNTSITHTSVANMYDQ